MFARNFVLKVPKDLGIFYSEKQSGVILQKFIKKKFVGFLFKLYLSSSRHFIYVTNFLLSKGSQFFKNQLAARVKYYILLKKCIIEILTMPYKNIFFFGVGFKASLVQKTNYLLLKLSLGFSHNIFIVLNNILEVCCFKVGNFWIFSNFYNNVYFLGFKLLNVKKMNPYKLKGFSYEHKSFFSRK